MPSIEQTVVNSGTLPSLLIEGENLDEGETAHDLHHIVLVVDRFTPTVSVRLIGSPDVRLQVRPCIRYKILACMLIVLGRWALDNFMADGQWFG